MYFVEHSQINQFAYQGAAFRGLSSFGSSGSGGGGIVNGYDPIPWRHPNNQKSAGDYPTFAQAHQSEKKTPISKSFLFNNLTSNYSRTDSTPVAAPSQRNLSHSHSKHSNGLAPTTEATDDVAKHQSTASDDLNKVYEYEENPQTNSNSSNNVKKVKVLHPVDVPQNVPILMEPQKSDTNAELIVPIASEPQLDITNNVIGDNAYLDVDTNLIDVGQRNAPRNGSKLEDKTLIKSRSSTDSELINLHTLRE